MTWPSFNGATSGQNVIAGVSMSGGTLNVNFNRAPAGAATTSASDPDRAPLSTVPFQQDVDFVARPAITEWLSDALKRPPHRAALVGLGGIGKSQLAIRFAHDVRTASPDMYVFWVHAGTTQRFEDAYRTIAQRLRLPGCRDPKVDVLQLVRNWLGDEANGRWLLVLDNADDGRVFHVKQADNREPLAAYLPQSENGSILVTSRSQDTATRLTGSHNSVWSVQALEEEQALQLLLSKLGKEDDQDHSTATDLIRALDRVPLAITQAAAYIIQRAPRMSISKYLTILQRNKKKKAGLLGKDMGDLRRDVSASNSIIATWQMTFDAIRRERASAADLLAFMSFFSPQGIPDWILRRYRRVREGSVLGRGHKRGDEFGETRNNLGDGSSDSDSDSDCGAFEDDLHILRQYSLVSTTMDEGVLEMHPTVQFCTQEWLSSAGGATAAKRAFFRVMAKEYPIGTYENWATCRALDPHIGLFEKGEPKSEGEGKDVAEVLTCAGHYRLNVGLYKASESILRKAVSLRERLLGPEHLDTLRSVRYLGSVLRCQGRYKEAEGIYRRVLQGHEKTLSTDHPDTLASVNNLGVLLQCQGSYKEAEKIHRRALEAREKTLGAEHLDTLKSIRNLGLVLGYQGSYKEAEKMHRRALEAREKTLGVDHPDTLNSVSSLGLVLRHQGRKKEAEKMQRRTLEAREKTLGVDHPNTLRSVSNLGMALRDQGRHGEAMKMFRRALEAREKTLGADHPDALRSALCLALLLRVKSHFKESEYLYDRAWEGLHAIFGSYHPLTLECGRQRSSLKHEMEAQLEDQCVGVSKLSLNPQEH